MITHLIPLVANFPSTLEFCDCYRYHLNVHSQLYRIFHCVDALMSTLPFILAHNSSVHRSSWMAFWYILWEYINERAKYVAEMHMWTLQSRNFYWIPFQLLRYCRWYHESLYPYFISETKLISIKYFGCLLGSNRQF